MSCQSTVIGGFHSQRNLFASECCQDKLSKVTILHWIANIGEKGVRLMPLCLVNLKLKQLNKFTDKKHFHKYKSRRSPFALLIVLDCQLMKINQCLNFRR